MALKPNAVVVSAAEAALEKTKDGRAKNGGNRKGAGRKKGSPNKANLERQAFVASTGITPLDYMLKVMRNEAASFERRDEMAKAAAPYVHPKLSSIQHAGQGGGPIKVVISGDDKDLL